MDLGDLKVRVSADVSDVQKAVEQAARQGLQAAQQQAKTTEAALKGAASASTKLQESLSAISEYLADAGLNADEVAEAMTAIGGGATKAAEKVNATATAAKNIATPTKDAAKAADNLQKGFSLSGSTLLRAGAALAGVGLGINVVAGAARLIHDTIASTVEAQADWERSLVQVRALYGDIAPRVVALAQAQAAMPGVISSQNELLQANAAAGYLTTRYGVSPTATGALTTQAARLGGLFVLPEDQRRSLQQAFVDYAQTGGSSGQLQAATGQPFDALTLARRLGFASEAGLQALTPQQLADARTQLGVATAAQVNMRGQGEQRGLLDAQRQLQHTVEQAQAQLQNNLENLAQPQPVAVAGQSDLARSTNFPLLGPAGERQQQHDLAAVAAQSNNGQLTSALQDVKDARDALTKNSAALADNQRQLEQANAALAKLGVEAGSSAARLLSFTGSLEDTTSIARGDIGASAQAAVAARGRSAVPLAGVSDAELSFHATQTAYQQAYQNYVAEQAQGQSDNAIRDYLQRVASKAGPGSAAQRALDQATQAQPVQQAINQAQKTTAQLDLAQAQAEANLEQISLTQRERYVQLLRDTVELRLEDNQQQQQSIRASMDLVRAQQAALPAQFRASDAQYQGNLAQALAKQRMARLLRGEDVSNLPSIDSLIGMNVNAQLDEAENAPSLVQAQRGVEVAGRGASQAALTQALTEGQLRIAELANDAQNLRDIPLQTQHELELIGVNREQLIVQKDLRDYTLQLIEIMSSRPSGGSGSIDLGSLIFGQGGDVPAPQTLPGARRGPF